tara:strand:+ start:3177 stop:3920 length:744 start_codon:yes stop_codon:yes gene_type:complete
MVTAGLISGGLSIVSGIFGASAANKRRQQAAHAKRVATRKLAALENSRQEVTNPYANSKDLSSTMSNPYAQLGVATQAAEMQAEEADISLANTLDTIRATGASAGGATALAQAALQSKKGVSANIEQQEAANEKLKAQGEQNLQQRKTAEQQRMQNVDAQGNMFTFNATERRETAAINRTASQIDNAYAAEVQAGADVNNAITGAVGGVASTVGSMYSAGAFSPSPTTPSTSNFNMLDSSTGFGIGE